MSSRKKRANAQARRARAQRPKGQRKTGGSKSHGVVTSKYLMPALVVGALFLGLGAVTTIWYRSADTSETVTITLPQLTVAAAQGKRLFDANCAACHGTNAAGSGQGPPLIHDIYNPGHHDNSSFYRAVRIGTRQHHWRFGNMPAQPQVSEAEIASIVRYVRELQQANGIVTRAHRM